MLDTVRYTLSAHVFTGLYFIFFSIKDRLTLLKLFFKV